ncbi:Attractin-like protein 1 [Papilio xuthus]|uniref:Attractin-like protein 1 n=1 Tax=Papilio xuthus TaxID=66420 RepID=A0A0N0PA26_PAPXU|nr:Attractin-like protein 1 [Papilio xuthus]
MQDLCLNLKPHRLAPSSALYEYEVESRVWRPLPSAPTPRYLHTAIFVSPGVMLVFGGNAHNDSAPAAPATPAASKCYSAAAMIYDVRCGVWHSAPEPRGAARAAHAAALVTHRGRKSAIIYGGFDGRLRSDALVFVVGAACATYKDEHSCVSATRNSALACAWRTRESLCVALEEVGWAKSFDGTVKTCAVEPVLDEKRCGTAEWCGACTAAGCAWCGACYPSAQYCLRHTHQMALSLEECGGAGSEPARDACARYHSCAACHAHRHHHAHNAYGASFPLGGCRAWSTGLCAGGGAAGGRGGGCAAHAGCASCRAEPACGWCDDGEGGGRGTCLPGGQRRPHQPHVCPQHRWHFTRCPLCQCNGHAVCDEAARCVQPCGARAVGDHCDTCAPAHWGTPLNGGVCQPCSCNAQAVSCAADTGRCYCSTKGLAGDRCDKYKTAENRWYPIKAIDEGAISPAPRFAHSAVMYGDEVIVYGGVVASDEPERGGGLAGLEGRAGEVTNEVWRGRIQENTVIWSNATPTACSPHRTAPLKHCGGLHLSGHTAVLAHIGPTQKAVMVVFFGHSPHYGYMHIVQPYERRQMKVIPRTV